MKVIFDAKQKQYITVAQLPAVRKIISDMRDYPDLNSDALTALRIASGENGGEMLKASAEIAKNCRVWNAYNDESEDIDIWLKIYGLNYSGFYEIGVYLTDIWASTGDNADELRSHMYIRKFTEENN